MFRQRSRKAAIISTCTLVSCAGGQVLINEVLENPPGMGLDETGWEFVEFYGAPGASLDGMIFLVLKGGADDDRDGTPNVLPKIDEVFDLSGYTLDSEGFFTLVGVRADGESPVADAALLPNFDFDPTIPRGPENTRWRAAADFRSLSPPSRGSRPPRLDNHGSSTYMLARVRRDDPGRDALNPGVCQDTDFDGAFDHAVEHEGRRIPWPRLQIVDEIAWSNRAGREYTALDENELSETHGLNPDAISRVMYYINNPMRGSRTKDTSSATTNGVGFEILPTTIADESFFYGTLDSETFPASLTYFSGFDLDGWPQLCGPTDRSRTPYGRLSRDPQPDTTPYPAPVTRDPSGSVYLDDLFPVGLQVTPGAHNDDITSGITQFRIVRGDVDFNGRVDRRDVEFASALLGASTDDVIEDPGSPTGDRYKWQGPTLQQLLAILAAAPDTPGTTVTHAHIAAIGRLTDE